MDLMHTLSWLCGRHNEVPSELLHWSKPLQMEIRGHRLECRLLEGLIEAGFGDTETVRQMQYSRDYFLGSIRTKMGVLSEIVGPRPGMNLLIVKGFSTFVASQDTKFLRYSNDMDMLSDKPRNVADAFVEASFVPDKAISAHDFANFRRGDLPVEVHAHFPSWALPSDTQPQDFMPSPSRSIWRQPSAMIRHEIKYEHMKPHSLPFGLPDGGTILLPNVTLCLLLSCVHAFRDYMSLASVYGRCKPRVRLGDLAEFDGLARHPTFDRRMFQDLVGRHGGHDAIEWSSRVLRSLLGESPVPDPPNRQVSLGDNLSARFPRHIWGDFLAIIEAPDIAIFDKGLPIGSIVEQLGANIVKSDGQTFSTSTSDSCRPLTRFLVKPMDDKIIHAECAFAREGDLLLVDTLIKRPCHGRIDRLRIDLGKYAFEWDRVSADGRIITREHLPCAHNEQTANRTTETTSSESNDGLRLKLQIRLSNIFDASRLEAELPMLLGVAVVGPGSDLQCGTLIPIRLGPSNVPAKSHLFQSA